MEKAKPEAGNYVELKDGTIKKVIEVKTATSVKLQSGEWIEEEDIKEVLVPKHISKYGSLLSGFEPPKTNGQPDISGITKHEWIIKSDTSLKEGDIKFIK